MSRVYSDTVLPEDSGVTQDLTLGTTGDTVQVTSGASLNVNTVKDSGGNTIFTSDGSGVLSSLNAGLAGKPILLDTNTFTDASSSSFTSGIDSTYKVYLFKFYDLNPATDGPRFAFQCSSDGGSNYNLTITSTAFESYNRESGGDSGLRYTASEDLAQGTGYQYLSKESGSGTDESTVGELYLFSPSNTTYVKQFYATLQEYFQGDYSFNNFRGGYFNTTSAINAIDFKMTTGNFDGTIKMYGL